MMWVEIRVSFIQNFSSTIYFTLGTALGAKDIAVNKRDRNALLQSLHFSKQIDKT